MPGGASQNLPLFILHGKRDFQTEKSVFRHDDTVHGVAVRKSETDRQNNPEETNTMQRTEEKL